MLISDKLLVIDNQLLAVSVCANTQSISRINVEENKRNHFHRLVIALLISPARRESRPVNVKNVSFR